MRGAKGAWLACRVAGSATVGARSNSNSSPCPSPVSRACFAQRDHLWPASAEALHRRKRARAEEAARRHPLDEVGAEEDEGSDSRLVGVTVRLLGDAAEVVPFRFLFRSAGAWCEVEGPPSRPQPRARVSDASACEAYVLVGANEWQPWKDWWG